MALQSIPPSILTGNRRGAANPTMVANIQATVRASLPQAESSQLRGAGRGVPSRVRPLSGREPRKSRLPRPLVYGRRGRRSHISRHER